MILADTSVWVDHFRSDDKMLAGWLNAGMVLMHPFILGELALGNLRQRDVVLAALSDLPHAAVATDAEVLNFIGHNALFGRGIGYVDAHLLAGAKLTANAELWTKDKVLNDAAARLSLAFKPRLHGP